jgi:dihydrofolate synthase / folylpolyglutamate synthase
MVETIKSKADTSRGATPAKQYSYAEIIEFLEKSWANPLDSSLKAITELDALLGSPSKKLSTIMVAGNNGKSLTINFVTQLLKEEGLSVGSFYSPHILTYNERISLNNETINNKAFTKSANDVITAAQETKHAYNGLELMTMIALKYFQENNVDVAVLEVSTDTLQDPVTICNPSVTAITRVINHTEEGADTVVLEKYVRSLARIAQKNSWLISADQSKFNLQTMQDEVTANGGKWAMPIRKLATLPYPLEQLHGRCAALAERTAQIYMQNVVDNDQTVVSNSLLIVPKGQRGRPTIEAKLQSELNPRRTIEQFWKETTTSLPGRFQLLDKDKPSILLDNASNMDAMSNLFLGIRLLHYQCQLKGLAIIVGCEDNAINRQEYLKLARYFFKKTSGHMIFCPLKKQQPLAEGQEAWNVEQITNDMKNVKVKARSANSFTEAYETACKLVDDRNGLVVVTGSPALIAEYWEYKDIKKLN